MASDGGSGSSGCGCSLVRRGERRAPWALAIVALLMLTVRRRVI
jgi:hypothetical protein